MDLEKVKEYEAELANAMRALQSLLGDAIKCMGIIESFIHLSRKELSKKDEVVPVVTDNNHKE